MSMISMASLCSHSAELSLADFQTRHGEAFLLYSGRQEELRPARLQWQPTFDTKGRRSGMVAPEDLAKLIVHPLPARELDPYLVTVGRVEPNHIVLPDESVSVFHAVFRRASRGDMLLEDAGSRNGTFVNDRRVAPREAGRPTQLLPNDRLRFGSVVLTFLLPPELHDLVQVLAAATPRRARPALRPEDLFDSLTPAATPARPLSSQVIAVLEAVQRLEDGHIGPAIEQLRAVLAREPDNASARVWLMVAEARQLRDAGDRRGAVTKYREILDIDPTHAEAKRALGIKD
jgi:hypothetical protein